MSKANTEVKWFHSGMLNAPVCRGEAGALIEVLDACLINGFSTRTPDSITVADGVATVALSGGNPYEKHAVIKITGASIADLNDEWRIATATSTALTFLCPDVADGTASGASVIRAPAGWAKPFDDTHVAVYQSNDHESTQLYLRVNDADARYPQVRGYENMTGPSTGTGDFPLLSAVTAANWTWPKSSTASTAARQWVVIADDSFMWVLIHASASASDGKLMHHFGDIKKFLSTDGYHCTITALWNSTTLNGANHAGAQMAPNASNFFRYYARAVSQMGGPQQHGCYSAPNSLWCGAVPISGSVDGRLHIPGPVLASANNLASGHVRVIIPGAVATIERPNYADLTVVEHESRVLLAVVATVSVGTDEAVVMFDILGPWRCAVV